MTFTTMIIGCGAVAHKLYRKPLRRLERTGDICVVALVDPSAQQARSLQSGFSNAQIYKHAAEALHSGKCDIAIVLSPAHLHAEHAILALQSNCHVLVEKPMATSASDCTSMIDAMHGAERILSIGMVRRYFPAFRRLKQVMDSGELGYIRNFEYREGKRFDWDVVTPAGFQKRPQGGSGVLFDIGPHAIDLLIWLFGELEVVSAADDAVGGVDTNVRLQLRTNSCTGLLQLSWDVPLTNFLKVQGSRGEAILALDRFDKLAIKTGHYIDEVVCDSAFPADTLEFARRLCTPSLYTDAIHCQLVQVLRAIRWGESLGVDGESGRTCVSLLERALSIRQPLEMDWLDRNRNERFRQLYRSIAP